MTSRVLTLEFGEFSDPGPLEIEIELKKKDFYLSQSKGIHCISVKLHSPKKEEEWWKNPHMCFFLQKTRFS